MRVLRLIIHVGRQKTGTTALQRLLHRRRAALVQRGVLYPTAGRRTQGKLIIAHHPFAAAVRQAPDQAREIYRHILRECEQEGCHTVILSSESFLNLKPTLLAELLRMEPEPLDVLVIGYLRNPFLFSVSSYAQRVQASHYSDDFATWLVSHSGSMAALIDQWKDTFKGMRWRYYQRETLLNQSIEDDFLNTAGLADLLADQEAEDFSSAPANPSISGNLIWIKRRINEACVMQKIEETHYTLFGELALHERFRRQDLCLSTWVKQALIQHLWPEMKAIEASGVVANAPPAETMMRDAQITPCREMSYAELREDLDWLRQQPCAAPLVPLLPCWGGGRAHP